MKKLAMIAGAVAVLPAIANAQSPDGTGFKAACAQEGARIVAIPTTFSSGGDVRAEYIFACINDRIRKIAVYFVAASQHDHAYPDADHAPWFGLRLKNSQGSVLFENPSIVVATTQNCHGYYEHVSVLNVPSSLQPKDVDNGEAFMGGTNSQLNCEAGSVRPPTYEDLHKAISEGKKANSEINGNN